MDNFIIMLNFIKYYARIIKTALNTMHAYIMHAYIMHAYIMHA